MYTQQEIEQYYHEATGHSLRPNQTPSRSTDFDTYFKQAFEQIDDLTVELTSGVTRG